jgi:tRNA nucleotidyltransferase (CCA-adding enzyme)
MQPFALWRSKAGDGAIRRLALKVVRIDRLLRVAQADDEGRLPEMLDDTSDGADLAWLAERAEQLRIAAAAPKPILMGRHLIALGYKPSGKFGEWLAAVFEAQLDGAFTDLDGAIAYFTKMVS